MCRLFAICRKPLAHFFFFACRGCIMVRFILFVCSVCVCVCLAQSSMAYRSTRDVATCISVQGQSSNRQNDISKMQPRIWCTFRNFCHASEHSSMAHGKCCHSFIPSCILWFSLVQIVSPYVRCGVFSLWPI